MDFAMMVALVMVGLLAGWLTEFAMRDGGDGLGWNLILGLAGSSAASNVNFTPGEAPGHSTQEKRV